MTTLTGRIVRLEPLGRQHEEPLWEAAQDERAWTWMTVYVRTHDDFERWLRSVRAYSGAQPFATLVHGVPLGSTSYLNLREHDRVVEVGATWLNPRAWNTGANAEAKYLQLRHAFEELAIQRVEFKTDAKNERARRALEAIGATFEGIHRKHMVVRDGERRDSAWYAVIDDDWPVVKAQLEARLARYA